MFLADVTAIALSIVGLLLSLQGIWLMCRALWPDRVRRTAQRCRTDRLASLLVGIPITLALLGLANGIGRRGGMPGHVIGWAICGLFFIYAGTGMSGFVTFVGERLSSPTDAMRPWWSTVKGGAAVELAALFPVIGWFMLLPLILMLGVGAVTLSFFGGTPNDELSFPPAARRCDRSATLAMADNPVE